MKKTMLIIVASFVLIVLLTGAYMYKANLSEVVYHANWVDGQSNIGEAYKNSDLVLIGRPKSSTSEKVKEVVFTRNTIEVKKVLKGNASGNVTVSLTGGDYQGVKYRAEKQKLLNLGDTYLLLLKKDAVSDSYFPIGGYQGIIKVNADANAIQAVGFNSENSLEVPMLGKDVLSEIKN